VLQRGRSGVLTDGKACQSAGIYEDDDTIVVLWDGAGTTSDGLPYTNTCAWFLTMRGDLLVSAVAFFDGIAFNELWSRVQPAE
jgi:ketosteroid isomerase-like protein